VSLILLSLTLLASITTLATGKTAVLQGVVHLVIFLAYLFLTLVP
jgi:Ca2+:H+ antiporter